MIHKRKLHLSKKKTYLQVALNGNLDDALSIISSLPRNDRIIVEAGTPFIKRYGEQGIRDIVTWYGRHLSGETLLARQQQSVTLKQIFEHVKEQYEIKKDSSTNLQNIYDKPSIRPYVVADLKMMDRGSTEVSIASRAGASAAVALGHAPTESLNAFIEECQQKDLDSMIDMMNVDFPLAILDALKKQPDVVILHRGVDETRENKEKTLPLHEIRRVKGRYDVLIAVAGGDTMREIQSAMFNDADIAVVWKDFYTNTGDTYKLAQNFIKQIK